MQKGKRGQLTIFVIIAIVIVVLILLYVYYGQGILGEKKYDPKVEVLRQEVLDCFESDYKTSLSFIGLQGGYLNVPKPREEQVIPYLATVATPYYYYKGKVNYPSVEDMQTNVAELVDSTLVSCFEEAKTSDAIDSVEFGDHDTKVTIEDGLVTFTTNVLMTVKYDNKSAIVDFGKKSTAVDSEIYHMHELAVFIADYLAGNNEWVPYSDIVEMSSNYDLYVNLEDDTDGSKNFVEIWNLREGYSPQSFSVYNSYGAMDLEEVLPLL